MTILVPFHELSDAQLAEVVAIYEEALAAPWEWPSQQLIDLARLPDGRVRAFAAFDGETVAGFTVNEYLPVGRVWYVHYLAVRADLRSQGWGSRILTVALPLAEDAARAAGHTGCLGGLLEVEAVDSPPPDADRRERIRRHEFYARHGALATAVVLPRPPWAPPEMPDWDLLFIPLSAWQGRIDAALRRTLLRALMVESYGFPEDAPWLAAALAALTDDTTANDLPLRTP